MKNVRFIIDLSKPRQYSVVEGGYQRQGRRCQQISTSNVKQPSFAVSVRCGPHPETRFFFRGGSAPTPMVQDPPPPQKNGRPKGVSQNNFGASCPPGPLARDLPQTYPSHPPARGVSSKLKRSHQGKISFKAPMGKAKSLR